MVLRFSQLLTRFCIVIFWVLLIFLFLYIPNITEKFHSTRSLSIFSWSQELDPIYLKQFEQKTGIKLYISYYETNDELMSKMEATQGKGYDIIIPSDYILPKFIKRGFLKKLDKSKLNFLNKIDPRLLGHYFDPKNEYSIPYFWAAYGIGFDIDYFGGREPEATWALVFDPKKMPTRVGMTDNIREAICITAQYLFGNIDALKDPKNLEKVKETLIEQKKRVEVYSEVRAEEMLLAKSCPVAVGLCNEIWRAARENPDIGFFIPKEGSFLNIDYIVIPKATEKDDLIYQFINYLYQPEVSEHHMEKFGLCPTLITSDSKNGENFCPTTEEFKLLHFIKDIISKKKLNEVWLAVMAS